MKEIRITAIEAESIAEELEVEAGDQLLTINGKVPKDIFDYYYLVNDEELLLEIQKPSGEIWELEIEKELDESLGLEFEEGLLDEPKSCFNKCVFCFIDQLPKGMRPSLYFKDDDTRLSFMHGNYVTLTNLKEEEIQRIIDYRIQPINISVHSTDPQLRRELLNNKNAGKIMEYIDRFADHGMLMNSQIVLCPDLNDKVKLSRSLEDLAERYPYMETVSVVPVGITKFRQNLAAMRLFTQEEAEETIRRIQKMQELMLQKHQTRFVFASDEFYLTANRDLPPADHYEGFRQLENGVGMLRLFMEQAEAALERLDGTEKGRAVSVATGKLAKNSIQDLVDRFKQRIPSADVQVHCIENRFFGEKITVTGLLTGRDLVEQLKEDGHHQTILIPENMLKHDEPLFLDDMTLEEAMKALDAQVIPVSLDGDAFVANLKYLKN
ncbi:DUF512 domain-containing protein [Alkalibacter rhizosphaerae]|uniref:DUF512 domain-containing protein n=1 Tax=Alkalibacter rhizosphaerae TaxID=2815577 RepID=A0A974XFI7_9FIRM|nr:DUF512 domain-containing protein [Alkalibacter rhizosphaerae]QSX08766.1 DUF512 domain-containing protein [Alkalibacter rhizosphaerae]